MSAVFLLCVCLGASQARAQTIVTITTDLGSFEIEMLEQDAPITVENFLGYVNRDDYDGTFIHRSVPGFVIQGGGYRYNPENNSAPSIPREDPIVNEFGVSNTRGTVAMAKLGGDPDSATSEWFVNLADNSENLDNQNGGFTVFGRVIGDGMDVVDAIAALPIANLGGTFSNTPTIDFDGSNITADIFVDITASVNATDTDFSLEDARDFSATERRVLGAYLSYFGRPADLGGLAFWTDQLTSVGGDLTSIIFEFGNAEEFVRRFGDLTNAQLIENLYDQILGRAPDPGGFDYWLGELDSGRRSLQEISVAIFDGVQNADIDIVNNRLAFAELYVSLVEESRIVPLADTALAELIDGIGAADSTVTQAIENLEQAAP